MCNLGNELYINTMGIFSVCKLSFICILLIGLLSQAFGQSFVDIRKSSPWKPGYQTGLAVKCGYTYPLSFSDGDLKLKSEAKRPR